MFDYIIISSPSASATELYEQLLSHSLAHVSSSTTVLCVNDPPGTRLGSGGGTLNALSYVHYDSNLASKRVAIIHSGGESRRAPLHSVCGKCFATFNSKESDELATPIVILIAELEEFCRGFSQGFVVVASCDVLLDIPRGLATVAENAFTVVAVPAIMSLATNHGVIIPPASARISLQSEAASVAISSYLQKPSISTMQDAHAGICTDAHTPVDPKAYTQAWIDTGVVIAMGSAFEAMIALMSDPVLSRVCCGLSPDPASTHSNFLKPPKLDAGIQFELYSDVLLALAFGSGPVSYEEYLGRIASQGKGRDNPALSSLWTLLRDTPLYSFLIPSGHFAHLGTSAELLQLVTYPPADPVQAIVHKCEFFSQKYKLQRLVSSCIFPTEATASQDGVLINSMIESSVAIGKGSLVEHSIISGASCIGQNCIASHVCGAIGRDLIIADNLLVQQVSVRGTDANKLVASVCLVVLGLNDDVKAPFESSAGGRFCGATWLHFLKASTLAAEDIWHDDVPRSLWTAKLYPLLSADASAALTSEESDLLWVLARKERAPASWIAATRLSLADLLQVGDASQMFTLRHLIRTFVTMAPSVDLAYLSSKPLSSMYLRLHRVLAILRPLVFPHNPAKILLSMMLLRSLGFKSLEIYPDLCVSFCRENMITNETTIQQIIHEVTVYFVTPEICYKSNSLIVLTCVRKQCSSLEICDVYKLVLRTASLVRRESHPRVLFILAWLVKHIRLNAASSHSLGQLTKLFLESVGMNAESNVVVTDSALESTGQRIVYNQIQMSLDTRLSANTSEASRISHRSTVIVSAPVRIDLAGGWSDTPPLCYESSGAVFNVAVRVNNVKPICCIARPISEFAIRLKVYHYVPSLTGANISLHEHIFCDSMSTLSSLCECKDPTEPCALLKAALIVLGLRDEVSRCGSNSSAFMLSKFGFGFEVCSFSGLPAGSGMGGSSVLSATVIQAVSHMLGSPVSDVNILLDMVTAMEQVMTSGGGYQDQVLCSIDKSMR